MSDIIIVLISRTHFPTFVYMIMIHDDVPLHQHILVV